MRFFALTVLVGCVTVAVIAACKSDDEEGTTPADGGPNQEASSTTDAATDTTTSASTTCTAYADAACRRLERCSPLLMKAVVGELAECKERYAILCERMSKAPGSSPFTEACVAALDESCEAYPEDKCPSGGTLADGTPCEFNRQCASGRCAGVGGSEYCGTCKPKSGGPKQEDASCLNDECDRGLSCIGFSWSVGGGNVEGKCEKTRTLGQACTDAEDCNSGGRCRGDSCPLQYGFACLDGGCALPLEEGLKCPPNGALGPSCNVRSELLCQLVPEAGLATACQKIVFAKANEACKRNEGPGNGSCFGSSRCIGDAGAATCIPRPVEGAPCTEDEDCLVGAACIGNVCTIAPPDRCK